MKIQLLKTEDNHLKGWDIIPENEDEQLVLGSIRNAIFFGLDDSYPRYDGRESEVKKDENGDNREYITKLMWRIPKYNK